MCDRIISEDDCNAKKLTMIAHLLNGGSFKTYKDMQKDGENVIKFINKNKLN